MNKLPDNVMTNLVIINSVLTGSKLLDNVITDSFIINSVLTGSKATIVLKDIMFSVCLMDANQYRDKAQQIHEILNPEEDRRELRFSDDYYCVRIPKQHYFMYVEKEWYSDSSMNECYRLSLLLLEDFEIPITRHLHDMIRILKATLYEQLAKIRSKEIQGGYNE